MENFLFHMKRGIMMKWIIRKIATVLLALVISIANINFAIAESQISDEQQNHLEEVTNGEIDLLGIVDIQSPELTDVRLSSYKIEAPGSIEVEVSGTDDISGLSYGLLRFEDSITGKRITVSLSSQVWNEETYKHENLPEGILKGVAELDQYQYPGEYELVEVRIEDRAGNMQHYVQNASDWQLDDGYKELDFQRTITVSNVYVADSMSPELKDIRLSSDKIEVPGSIEVEASGTDDISGISYGLLRFEDSITGKRITVSLSSQVWNEETYKHENLPEGILKGVAELDQYQYPGEYELVEVRIEDRAGNMQHYVQNASDWQLDDGYKELDFQKKITVINTGQYYELSTNTNNPNLAEDIKNILSPPEGEPSVKIGINYETGSLLSGEVFKSIAGENKEIILEGGSIQWIFNGKDIDQNNIKEIDLGVNISRLDNSFSGSYDDITDIVKEQPTYVLSFADNGALPGKATIRLKADYAFIDHLGRNDLCVYYYDSKNDKLVNIKNNIDVSNDGFIEFSIYHNSDFIITKGEVPDRTSGSTESSSGNKKREKPISAEKAINSLKQKEKDIIVNNFKEALPYTSLIPELTIVQLKELTNNIFTEAQLKEIHKNMNLLQELGIDYSVYKSSYVELKPVENILFSDVPEIHWANEVIKKAGKLGIIAGMPEGTFLPNENLKVADAFSFLDRILLINGINEAKQNRSLVEKYINNKENWAFHSVASISSKLEENTIKEVSFIGEDYLSRELLAQVIYETTSGLFPELKNEANFTDIGNSPYKNAIEYCVSQEILKGTGINKMEPAKPVTRAEMIAIIVRINNKFKDIE